MIGHNILAYDLAVLAKLYPQFSTDGIKVTDTLVLSRLIRANLRDDDHAAGYTLEQLHKRLYGSHSLKAWGLRLGVLKGEYGETSDWSSWSQEMQDYCQQDVSVTVALWKHLAPETWSQRSIALEHSLAEICHRIGQAGWTFDKKKAGELYARLSQERAELQDELNELFPPWTVEEEFIPKVNNKTRGYVKGEPFIKRKEVQFNPNSRKHIEFCLKQKYKWKPREFTPSGDAKIDETILNALPYPEAKKLAHSFLIQKRIGMLAEGNSAWMKLAVDDPQSPRYGLLRHTINPNGTVTGRASHFGPNLAQVPATRAPYGKECRELFTVPPGYVLVGSDLSGLELRCLAHFMNDGGKFAKELLEGDIHTANMAAFGVADRDQSKAACVRHTVRRRGQQARRNRRRNTRRRTPTARQLHASHASLRFPFEGGEGGGRHQGSPGRPGLPQATHPQRTRCPEHPAAISRRADLQEVGAAHRREPASQRHRRRAGRLGS